MSSRITTYPLNTSYGYAPPVELRNRSLLPLSRQASVLVHMMSGTFGFWIGIVGGAGGTPAAWHSPALVRTTGVICALSNKQLTIQGKRLQPPRGRCGADTLAAILLGTPSHMTASA